MSVTWFGSDRLIGRFPKHIVTDLLTVLEDIRRGTTGKGAKQRAPQAQDSHTAPGKRIQLNQDRLHAVSEALRDPVSSNRRARVSS